jgi:hypothetical protein
LTAAHLPGKLNEIADSASRHHNDDIEWSIKGKIFVRIIRLLGSPQIDLFASRLNKKLDKFVSWRPDPASFAIGAFSLSWHKWYSYIFPPFSLLPAVLKKLQYERADAIVILPIWPTQLWFPRALQMAVDTPRILPRQSIYQPQDLTRQHPLEKKMLLAAVRLSGNLSATEDFQRQLSLSSPSHGESQRRNNTVALSRNGSSFVTMGRLILFVPL